MRTSKGFSILELLMVIFIVVILMSLLIPILALVRDSARDTTCKSNLRQIHIIVYQSTLQTQRLPLLEPLIIHPFEPMEVVLRCPSQTNANNPYAGCYLYYPMSILDFDLKNWDREPFRYLAGDNFYPHQAKTAANTINWDGKIVNTYANE